MDARAIIIDPPYEAAFDINVAKRWVKELEELALQGYEVGGHLIKARKNLAFLEMFENG